MSAEPTFTVVYSKVDDLEIKLDGYIPTSSFGKLPTVLFFHGGGLTCGDRKDLWFPHWLRGEHPL